jgi:hypothetical protein
MIAPIFVSTIDFQLPADFVGRGDMSRGGLMLRCVRSGIELPYIPVQGALRHGMRPPRLEKKTLYMPRRSPDDSCNTPGLPLAAFNGSRR